MSFFKFDVPQVVIRAGLKKPARPERGALQAALEASRLSAGLRLAASMQQPQAVVGGVPNPYGVGLSAFEPATEVFNESAPPVPTYEAKQPVGGVTEPMLEGYDAAFNAVQQSRVKESEAAASSVSSTSVSSPAIAAGSGAIGSVIQAAQGMLGKPYVWGGTTVNGVDCSGLIYYAFNAAGIKMPRLRAIDYGKMGQQVSGQDARAGDLVYWDSPNTTTDHVGIYLGNGMVIQSPQSGDVTKISKVWGNPTFRRVFNDTAFGTQATPTGTTTSYQGSPANDRFLSSLRTTVVRPYGGF